MTHHIILISGYARSGKDTLANAIIKQLRREKRYTHMLKFADALRTGVFQGLRYMLKDKITLDDLHTEDDKLKEKLRPLLVSFGEYARSIYQDVFVAHTIERIDAIIDKADGYSQYIFIPDTRYVNESKVIKEYAKKKGGIVVSRLHVLRDNNKPGNPVEEQSLKALNDYDDVYRTVSFADGDLEAIEQYAKTLFGDMPWSIRHEESDDDGQWLKGSNIIMHFTDLIEKPPIHINDLDSDEQLEQIKKDMLELTKVLKIILDRLDKLEG